MQLETSLQNIAATPAVRSSGCRVSLGDSEKLSWNNSYYNPGTRENLHHIFISCAAVHKLDFQDWKISSPRRDLKDRVLLEVLPKCDKTTLGSALVTVASRKKSCLLKRSEVGCRAPLRPSKVLFAPRLHACSIFILFQFAHWVQERVWPRGKERLSVKALLCCLTTAPLLAHLFVCFIAVGLESWTLSR